MLRTFKILFISIIINLLFIIFYVKVIKPQVDLMAREISRMVLNESK